MLLAFDMFGTLADTVSVVGELAAACGDRAAEVAQAWRRKQVEYMVRVTAMGQFPPFADLTSWGLVGALAEHGFSLSEVQTGQLVGAYRRLRPFDDVRPAVQALHERGDSIVVFSVGPRAWLEELTGSYRQFVDGIVSAEEVGAYKPHPAIYRHLLDTTKTEPAAALLVSSNPFDVIGAASVGLRTAWCRRDPSAIFDPWGPRPDHVITGLAGLADVLPPPRRASGSDT
ncbi:MAG: haloacid dehalogenase type II [Conexibacteraceae bacterium]|nr:haloacid dehalogenase type II [Conexibacteraceae bacterium]